MTHKQRRVLFIACASVANVILMAIVFAVVTIIMTALLGTYIKDAAVIVVIVAFVTAMVASTLIYTFALKRIKARPELAGKLGLTDIADKKK